MTLLYPELHTDQSGANGPIVIYNVVCQVRLRAFNDPE